MFRGNSFNSFCAILVTNQQNDQTKKRTQVKNITLGEVSGSRIFPQKSADCQRGNVYSCQKPSHILPPCVQNNAAQKVIVITKIIFPTGNKLSQIFPINNQYEVKGIQEIASWLHSHARTHTHTCLSITCTCMWAVSDDNGSTQEQQQARSGNQS